MSNIELDAFEAFLDAFNEADRELSGREMGRIIRYLYDAGWQLTRKPEPDPVPIEPAPVLPEPPPDQIPF